MLKAVYRMNTKPDMTMIVNIVSSGNSFNKTVIYVKRSEGAKVFNSFIKEGFLHPHQVCGGSFSVKYRNEQLGAIQDLRSAGVEIYANEYEWLTLAENFDKLPIVLLNNAARKFRPTEMGQMPGQTLGGNLSPADYVNGSRSRD